MKRWVLVGMAIYATTAFAAQYEALGVKLDVVATQETPEVMLGEPGFVKFKVCNPSDRTLWLQLGGDYRNRLGRPNSFRIETVGPDGKKVMQPDSGFDMGGMIHELKLPAKGEGAVDLFLPHWATFEKPGTYTMTIRRKLTVFERDAANVAGKSGSVEVTATATINVVPLDRAKLGMTIDTLGKRMVAEQGEYYGARLMMNAIRDERVVPYYVTLAELPHDSPRSAACDPLGRYNSDPAFAALKKLSKTTAADVRDGSTTLALAESSADGVRHSAAHALGTSPHPKALPYLWTLVDDRYYGVRMTVLHKAFEVKTPEARAIIRQLTADENERVRDEAKRYQKLLDAGAGK